MSKKIDIIIIGAGPAGISAAIYAKMDNINYLLIEKNKPCWFLEKSINSHYYVDGFTGVKKHTTGTNLRSLFLDHYKRLGGKIVKDEVVKIRKTRNDNFTVKTVHDNFITKAIIFASGTDPKTLAIPGTKTYKMNIHHFCTLDGNKYRGKNVTVVGGRNSGTAAACYLHDISCKVKLVEIKDSIQCEEKYKKKLGARKIEVYTSANIVKFVGNNKKLTGVELKIKGLRKTIESSGIFLYVGLKPSIAYSNINLNTNSEGYIIVDIKNQTSQPGIFAAGDVTGRLKQAITACGDGANALYFAKKYVATLTKKN